MPYDSQHAMGDGELLDQFGHLLDCGFATKLCRRYDRKAIRAGSTRIKEWDYYCIADDNVALALTIADNSYMGLDSVSLLRFEDSGNTEHTKSLIRLFPMGKTRLPASSEQGDVEVVKPAYHLRFLNDGTTRTLTVHLDDFKDGKPLDATVVLTAHVADFLDGKPLDAEITLTDAPRDSMVIATPFPNKPKAFYYNQKINCLRASGHVAFGDWTHDFTRERALGVLDWGRGVWTYRNTWDWSSLSALVDGEPFGLNLGYGFGDTSAATENMIFWRGEAHKLEHVAFHIPKAADGREDFLKPWRVDCNNGRLDLTFTPALDRASKTSVLLIESDQHQVFGHFDGTAILDDGTRIRLEHLLGFAEMVKNRW